jgi:hypothetical protein
MREESLTFMAIKAVVSIVVFVSITVGVLHLSAKANQSALNSCRKAYGQGSIAMKVGAKLTNTCLTPDGKILPRR